MPNEYPKMHTYHVRVAFGTETLGKFPDILTVHFDEAPIYWLGTGDDNVIEVVLVPGYYRAEILSQHTLKVSRIVRSC